jgi:hypothetical protein
MSATILLLPQYAFVAWCSVEKSIGTTLPLTSPASEHGCKQVLVSRSYNSLRLFKFMKTERFQTLLCILEVPSLILGTEGGYLV